MSLHRALRRDNLIRKIIILSILMRLSHFVRNDISKAFGILVQVNKNFLKKGAWPLF